MAASYDKTYSDLSLWVSRDENEGAYLFGVTLNGADVIIAARKLGDVDTALQDAQQQQQQTQPPESTPAPSEPQPSQPQPQPQ